MSKAPLPTHFFALVVIRRRDRFLLVEERKGRGWYLPAGRVEPGETLAEAAVRETFEESGLQVTLDGLLRLEHTPLPHHTRVRAIFSGRASDDDEPRSTPNEHTLQARFVTLEEMDALPIRGRDVRPLFEAVLAGAPVAPLSTVTVEGADW